MSFDEDFKQTLKARATSSLFNPDEITDEAINVVSSEVKEECRGKDVKSWAVMDFAIIRLKIYLKIALSEEDIILLKGSINEIKNSPPLGQSKSGLTLTLVQV